MPREKKERRLTTVWILLDDSKAIEFLVLLIAISLAVVGIARVFIGIGQEDMKNSVRFMKIAIGFIALGIGVAVSIIDYGFPSNMVDCFSVYCTIHYRNFKVF